VANFIFETMKKKRKKPAVIVEVERMRHAFTGLYYFSLQLAENLYKYHRDEFDFTFFKYPRVYFPKHLKTITRSIIEKTYLYKDYKYDIWHGTWQLTKYVPKGKIKFVYTIHDLNFLYTDMPDLEKKRHLAQIQKTIDRADIITTISHFVKEDVEKHLNTAGKDIVVVYNGVDLKEYPDFDNPRYRPHKPFLFAIGTVLYKKHFHVLPALLPGTDYELVIAGIHPDKKDLQLIIDEAKKYGVEDRVKLIGPVTDEEKYWYLKNMEAFLFPSISEGFGIPPVEAMRLGKPVFLSTHTSLPEIGGKYAYYFQNFDPEHMRTVLREGLKDYKENNRAGEIKQWSMNFTWKKAAGRYADVYRHVLKNDGSFFEPRKIIENHKISVIIPAVNAGREIEQTIRSAGWADEVLVIVPETDTQTPSVAEKAGAKIIPVKFDNFSTFQNKGVDEAANEWILVLEPGESMTEELANEIKEAVKKKEYAAYRIPREIFMEGKKIKYTLDTNPVKLFNRQFGKFNADYVHPEIRVVGKTGQLKKPLRMEISRNPEKTKADEALLVDLQARQWLEQRKKYHPFKHFWDVIGAFIKFYFFCRGFLAGKLGWKKAFHQAQIMHGTYKKLHEIQQ